MRCRTLHIEIQRFFRHGVPKKPTISLVLKIKPTNIPQTSLTQPNHNFINLPVPTLAVPVPSTATSNNISIAPYVSTKTCNPCTVAPIARPRAPQESHSQTEILLVSPCQGFSKADHPPVKGKKRKKLTIQRPPRRHDRQPDPAEPILQRRIERPIELPGHMGSEVMTGGTDADEGRAPGERHAVVEKGEIDGGARDGVRVGV